MRDNDPAVMARANALKAMRDKLASEAAEAAKARDVLLAKADQAKRKAAQLRLAAAAKARQEEATEEEETEGQGDARKGGGKRGGGGSGGKRDVRKDRGGGAHVEDETSAVGAAEEAEGEVVDDIDAELEAGFNAELISAAETRAELSAEALAAFEAEAGVEGVTGVAGATERGEAVEWADDDVVGSAMDDVAESAGAAESGAAGGGGEDAPAPAKQKRSWLHIQALVTFRQGTQGMAADRVDEFLAKFARDSAISPMLTRSGGRLRLVDPVTEADLGVMPFEEAMRKASAEQSGLFAMRTAIIPPCPPALSAKVVDDHIPVAFIAPPRKLRSFILQKAVSASAPGGQAKTVLLGAKEIKIMVNVSPNRRSVVSLLRCWCNHLISSSPSPLPFLRSARPISAASSSRPPPYVFPDSLARSSCSPHLASPSLCLTLSPPPSSSSC